MYIYIWYACRANGSECVDSFEEAKAKFAFDKAVYGAYRYEIRLRQTNELICKG